MRHSIREIAWGRSGEYNYEMKIIILRERCTGLANCVGVAPEVFDLDKEGRAVVVDPLNADDHILLRAARGCTQQAVVLQDDQGHQVYP